MGHYKPPLRKEKKKRKCAWKGMGADVTVHASCSPNGLQPLIVGLYMDTAVLLAGGLPFDRLMLCHCQA